MWKCGKAYGISGSRTKKDRLRCRNLISRHALPAHLPSHERLVSPEISAIADGFTGKRCSLPFEDPGDAICPSYFADGIPRARVQAVNWGLRLEPWIGSNELFHKAGRNSKACLRIRMCSTGPETTPLAKPARAPAETSWGPVYSFPSDPPRPRFRFWAAKKRFVDSRTANWMDTQTPIPRSGVRVPLSFENLKQERLEFKPRMSRRSKAPYKMQVVPHFLECRSHTAPCPNTSLLVQFACAINERLTQNGYSFEHLKSCGLHTTFTMSNGCPTNTCSRW